MRRRGIGASVDLTVGGRTDDLHGAPVAVTARVRHLDDGRFEDTGVTHGGFRFFDAGPRALLETDDGHFVLLTSRPMGNTSRAELTSVGLDPERCRSSSPRACSHRAGRMSRSPPR